MCSVCLINAFTSCYMRAEDPRWERSIANRRQRIAARRVANQPSDKDRAQRLAASLSALTDQTPDRYRPRRDDSDLSRVKQLTHAARSLTHTQRGVEAWRRRIARLIASTDDEATLLRNQWRRAARTRKPKPPANRRSVWTISGGLPTLGKRHWSRGA